MSCGCDFFIINPREAAWTLLPIQEGSGAACLTRATLGGGTGDGVQTENTSAAWSEHICPAAVLCATLAPSLVFLL